MMLSVLIPVFNWDIKVLALELNSQIASLGESPRRLIEVLVVDDGSTDEDIRDRNRSLFHSANERELSAEFRYLENKKNIGRSATRNRLMQESQGKTFLFLDADVLPDGNEFLRKYIDLINKKPNNLVCCGGISYKRCVGRIDKDLKFYLWYSSRASVKPSEIRQKVPWAWVFTANVLISRKLAMEHDFDSGFTAYGYEDIEWGIRLNKVTEIVHVENTVTHMGLLPKAVLLKKAQASSPNLIRLFNIHPVEANSIRAFRYAQTVSILPINLLKTMSWILSRLFIKYNFFNFIMYFLYQSEKVISASMFIKTCNYKSGKT